MCYDSTHARKFCNHWKIYNALCMSASSHSSLPPHKEEERYRLTTTAAIDLRLRTAFHEFRRSGLSTRLPSTSAILYLPGFFFASCIAASVFSLGNVGSRPSPRPTRYSTITCLIFFMLGEYNIVENNQFVERPSML